MTETTTTTTMTTILLFCSRCNSKTQHVRFDIQQDGGVILVCCHCKLVSNKDGENSKSRAYGALAAIWKNLLYDGNEVVEKDNEENGK